MKPQQRRWVCPSCGSGVNAPSKPRSDDVRRFCLPCSASSGRLVRRECPALERQRSAAREKSKARRATKVSAERAREVAARSAGDVDLLAEARRLWALPYLRRQPRWVEQLPSIELRRSRTKQHTSGHCQGNGRRACIVLTIGLDVDDPLGVLLHELVHAVMPASVNHSERYWTTLQCAARDAWPDAPFKFNEPAPQGWQKQRQIREGLRARRLG